MATKMFEAQTTDANSAVVTSVGSPVTLIWSGNFDTAKLDIEVSGYNDGSSDIYVPLLKGINGPGAEVIDVENNVKIRGVIRKSGAATSITLVQGGGLTA
jgi:hypothetical protein